MSKIYAIIYLSIFLEVTRRSGRLTKVDSRIAMSLKKWLKKSSKVLIRTFSLFLPSRIVFRLLLTVRRPQYGFRRQWGLSMPLTRGINHLCYSLRPAIVQTKLTQEIFYPRLNDPFCYDLVLGKNEPIIGEWLSENVTKGVTIIDVGSNTWFYTLRIAALIGAPGGSGRSKVNSGCSLSPLVYPNGLVQARWRALYGLNPMAGVIEGLRWAFTGQGRPPDLKLLASVGVVLVVVGELNYFNKMESTIASVV